MRGHIRLSTLVAGAAVAAAITCGAAASASAAPELGRCLAVAEGAFHDSKCANGGAGKFEWFPGFSGERPLVATGLSLSSSRFKFKTGKSTIECTHASASGHYTGSRVADIGVLTLTGCGPPKDVKRCTSAGREPGEIQTNALEGVFGEFAKGSKTAAEINLGPAEAGAAFAEFICGIEVRSWHGSMMLPVTSGKMTSSETWKASGKPTESLEGEKSGIKDGQFAVSITASFKVVKEESSELLLG